MTQPTLARKLDNVQRNTVKRRRQIPRVRLARPEDPNMVRRSPLGGGWDDDDDDDEGSVEVPAIVALVSSRSSADFTCSAFPSPDSLASVVAIAENMWKRAPRSTSRKETEPVQLSSNRWEIRVSDLSRTTVRGLEPQGRPGANDRRGPRLVTKGRLKDGQEITRLSLRSFPEGWANLELLPCRVGDLGRDRSGASVTTYLPACDGR